MRTAEALAGVTRLGVDTAPVIYFLEHHAVHFDTTRAVFERVDAGLPEAFTSTLTLTEVLTVPFRNDDTVVADLYRTRLLYSRNLTSLTVIPPIAEQAAILRARYRLRTPDAIQIATALHARCEAFLTNDRRLQRVTELTVLMVEDMEP